MDLLNLAAEERVNLADLSFALTDSILGQHAELAQGVVLSGSGAAAAAIVSGFVPTAGGAGGPVNVGRGDTVNSAFLCRLGADGALRPAQLIYGGTSVASIDISAFPSNTYGIYVRATRTPGAVENRAFWSGVDASEYAQLTPTRLIAGWEVRIETASPGLEWLRIGQAVVTAAQSGGQGATVVVTDQRPLLFEGVAASGYAPTWGTAADRGARQASSITSLAQMVDALKQCIVDIKGRGLQPWYAPTIGGMNVGGAFGLGDSPTNNRVAVGDKNFYISLEGDYAQIRFDAANQGRGIISYGRTGQVFGLINGQSILSLPGDGSVNIGSTFTSPAQAMLGVQSHTPWVGEFVSDASTGGCLVVSSRNNDSGGNLFFRPFVATSPDPSNGSWFWRMQGSASSTQLFFSLTGYSANGGGAVTPLSVTSPRASGSGVSITTVSGNQLYLQGSNVFIQNKIVYPSILPYVSGHVQSAKADATGQATGTSFGATSQASFARSLTNGRKVIVGSFGQLPANAVVVANAQRYSSQGDDQTGFSVQTTSLGSGQIEFCLTDNSGDSEYGSFDFVIFSAS